MRKPGEWQSPRAAFLTEREPVGPEKAAKELVAALALDWAVGDMDLAGVRRETARFAAEWREAGCSHATGGYVRWQAVRFGSPNDAAWEATMAMLDALIADDATDARGFQYATKHGTFAEADLRDAQAEISRTERGVKILFPVRVPWEEPPREDGDTPEQREGRRGRPIYARSKEERVKWAADDRRYAVHTKRRKGKAEAELAAWRE
jgi:hypothetical protein